MVLFSLVPVHGLLLGYGEAAPSASVRLAALQGRALEGACDDDFVYVTVGVWIIFYVGSGLVLKHMEKG